MEIEDPRPIPEPLLLPPPEAQPARAASPRPEVLPQALSALLGAEINISFSYPLLIRPGQNPVLVLHLDTAEFGAEVLAKAGFKVLKQEDLSR